MYAEGKTERITYTQSEREREVARYYGNQSSRLKVHS